MAAWMLAAALAPSAASAAGRGTCSVATATGIAFGTYDPFSNAPVLVTAIVRHRCSRQLLPRIALDGGTAASFAPRRMRSASDVLAYDLCLDAACTQRWGDGSAGTREYVAATSNADVTVFGRIPAGQDVSAGTYTDVVTVTFNF
jgi:spore coat protein U-like protein